MSNSGQPVLADFGAAQLFQEPTVISISTRPHGTTRYMAIELLNLDSVVVPTVMSDVWSLGMVIYVCYC